MCGCMHRDSRLLRCLLRVVVFAGSSAGIWVLSNESVFNLNDWESCSGCSSGLSVIALRIGLRPDFDGALSVLDQKEILRRLAGQCPITSLTMCHACRKLVLCGWVS